DLATRQQNLKDTIEKTKYTLAEMQQALAIFSTHPPAAKKPGKGSADRDELKDYLAEIEKQLNLLKKTSSEIDSIATRIVDSNRKLIRELADTGVIAFSDSIKLERDLLKEQSDLQTSLTKTQLDLVETAQQLAPGVADATAARKNAPRAKGQKGKDTRDRRAEI